MMLGRRYYWPIWRPREARPADRPARRQHVPLCDDLQRLAVALPARLRRHSQTFEDQLLSLIHEGVFEVPSLRVVLIESGVTWLPGFIWRAIKTWRGVRAEVPWVKRSPAETSARTYG